MLTVSKPDDSNTPLDHLLPVGRSDVFLYGVFLSVVLCGFFLKPVLKSCSLLFQVLHETFPRHTFLMNGLVQGVKVRPVDSYD